METLSAKKNEVKTLEQAEAEGLLRIIKRRNGRLVMTEECYQDLRYDGLTRANVRNGLNALAREGVISLEPHGAVIEAKLLEQRVGGEELLREFPRRLGALTPP